MCRVDRYIRKKELYDYKSIKLEKFAEFSIYYPEYVYIRESVEQREKI